MIDGNWLLKVYSLKMTDGNLLLEIDYRLQKWKGKVFNKSNKFLTYLNRKNNNEEGEDFVVSDSKR